MRKIFLTSLTFFCLSLYCGFGQIGETSSDRIEQDQKHAQEIKHLSDKLNDKTKQIGKLNKRIQIIQDSLIYLQRNNNLDNYYISENTYLKDSLKKLQNTILQNRIKNQETHDSLQRKLYLYLKSYEICKENDSINLSSRKSTEFDKIKKRWEEDLNKLNEDYLKLSSKENELQILLQKLESRRITLEGNVAIGEKQAEKMRSMIVSLNKEYESKISEIDDLRSEQLDIEKDLLDKKIEYLKIQNDISILKDERSKLRSPLFNLVSEVNLAKFFDSFFATNKNVYYGFSIMLGYYLDRNYNDKSKNSIVFANSISYVDSSLTTDLPTSVKNTVLIKSELGFFFNSWFLLSGGVVQSIAKESQIRNVYPTIGLGFYIPLSSNILLPIKANAMIVSTINEPVIGVQTGLSISFDLLYK